jgi:archaellum component FlaC
MKAMIGVFLSSCLIAGLVCAAESAPAASIKESVQENAQEKKEEFKKKMDEQLAKLHDEIDRLQAEAKAGGVKASERIQNELKRLEKKRADLQKNVDDATVRTGRAWSQVQTGFERAYDDLKKAFAKAQQEFKTQRQGTK